MFLTVNVKTKAREGAVIYDEVSGEYFVTVRSLPENDNANQEIILLMAKTLQIPRSLLSIKSGHRGKRKILLLNK